MEENRPHYNIVFSIPIHERFDVVIDQCINYLFFNPNCAIIIHISQSFDYKKAPYYKEFLRLIDKKGNIYVNPICLRTGLYDIVQTHISNFRYINQIVDFEYFAMASSNEMFIRGGVYESISCFDAGINRIVTSNEQENWLQAKAAFNDKELLGYITSKEAIVGSQIEGSYYKRVLYEKIVDAIESFYDYKTMENKYAREEIYFSTVLCSMADVKKINYKGCYTWINWPTLRVTLGDIKKINTSNNSPYYSVKRVDRVFDDIIRMYLRQINDYITEERDYFKVIQTYPSLSLWVRDYCKSISETCKYHLSNAKGYIRSKLLPFF